MPKIEVYDYVQLEQIRKNKDFNELLPLKISDEDEFNRYILTNNGKIMLFKSNMTLYSSNYSRINNNITDPNILKIYFDKNFKNDTKFIDEVNIFCDKIKSDIYEKYKIQISNNIISDKYYFESKMITGETMLKSTRIIFNHYEGYKLVVPPDIYSIDNITKKKWIYCIFYFLPIIYSKNDKYWFENKTFNINLYENPSNENKLDENILSSYEDDLIKNNIINRPITDNCGQTLIKEPDMSTSHRPNAQTCSSQHRDYGLLPIPRIPDIALPASIKSEQDCFSTSEPCLSKKRKRSDESTDEPSENNFKFFDNEKVPIFNLMEEIDTNYTLEDIDTNYTLEDKEFLSCLEDKEFLSCAE